MNVETGELAVGDDALKRAQLIKVSVEILAVALTACIYVQMLVGEDVKNQFKVRIRRLQRMLFGRPPMSEEQIQEVARQVHIEAAKILRSAE